MTDQKEPIAQNTAAEPAPLEQLSQMQLEMLRMLDPTFLATISMKELYERIFQRKPPIIDGLLNAGTYLFVGAPKLGKSFFMRCATVCQRNEGMSMIWNSNSGRRRKRMRRISGY